jgi:predicted ATPase
MALTRFSLENYRCFQARQEIELGLVTVVLGRNNSGKSALVRAPLVFSTGFDANSPLPLDLERLGEGAPSFQDLVYAGRPHGRVRLGFGFGQADDRTDVEATVQHIEEWQSQVVSELSVRQGQAFYNLSWSPEANGSRDTNTYEVSVGPEAPERPVAQQVEFQGLFPDQAFAYPHLGEHIARRLAELSPAAELDTIRYLSPYRDRPSRMHRIPARVPVNVGSSGEHAMGIIADDHLRRGSSLVRTLNSYLARNLPGWKLKVAERGSGMFSVELVTTSSSQPITVNLDDAGTGVTQLLPILVQRALDEVRAPEREVLEIVEEPELHLHPSAHALVADLFLKAATSVGSRVRFLVETHSETFLLRLRRRIAEGAILPEQVAVYFVEHDGARADVRRIGVDRLGNVEGWPRGVFSEDFDETQALAAAQMEQMDRT